VPPAKLVTLLLADGDASDRARVVRFASELRFLNKLDRIEWLDAAASAPPAATAVVGALKLLVPLEGLVDLDAERARLDKELARVAGERGKSEAKLAKFSDKVPAAVVEQERQRLADWTAQHQALQAQRQKL
jgi:valyl-tRNA synthetase